MTDSRVIMSKAEGLAGSLTAYRTGQASLALR